MIKKISLLFFLFTYFFVSLFAQAPAEYYVDAEGKTGRELKTAVHTIIKASHQAKSYAALWEAYKTTDKKPNGKVWDMYSDRPGGTPPYEYTFVTNQCGNYSGEGSCYNREHSFPKSWFDDASPMVSDVHHIYPTDGYVNGKRSSYPFGEVGSASWTSLNGSKVGSCSYSGYSGTVFEPIDEYKGDFARSHFYMVTRYEDKVAGWKNNGNATHLLAGNSYPAFQTWTLNMLIEWHEQDPVSQKEIDRNNAAYAFQGNRNPFVDHPEWVKCIWKNECGSIVQPSITIASITHAPLEPTAEESVIISTTISVTNGTLDNATLYWGTSNASLTNSISLSLVSGNLYRSTIPTQTSGTSIYYKIVAEAASVTAQSEIQSYQVRIPTSLEEVTISAVSHSPQQPMEGDVVAVRAKISVNNTELRSIKLHWGINPNTNNTVDMIEKSDGFYEAIIPSQNRNTVVLYKVVASADNVGSTSTAVSYVVQGPSTEGVVIISDITHSPIEPIDNEMVTVSATVSHSDNVAIDQVWLQWWSINEPTLIYSNTMIKENDSSYRGSISNVIEVNEICYRINVVSGSIYKQSEPQCYKMGYTIVPGIVENYVVFKNVAGKEFTNILKVEIYDAGGRQVSVQHPSVGATGDGGRVNISTLGKGLYIFRLWQTNNGKPQSFKIVL